jgi:tripartite ATP-independent transporter DctM subunit
MLGPGSPGSSLFLVSGNQVSVMEQLLKLRIRLNGKTGIMILGLVVVVAVVISIAGLSAESREDLLYTAQDFLPIVMFLTLATFLFSGFPVAFILGGIALAFGLIGYFLGSFSIIEFFNFLPRIWGQAAENLVLVAVPAFVFMGIVMERSGIAHDLLYCIQVLLKRVPGALALGVTIMGTILAAMTGIIGASVTMMTALALPTMLKQKYSKELSCGVIAASGTLGILIPPSIMLIIMADLMSVSVGNVFMAALLPGLVLAAFYLVFVVVRCTLNPSLAPPLPPELLHVPRGEMRTLLMKAFVPPVFLIGLIKGGILTGFVTPSEAGALGAFGALVLAVANRRLGDGVLADVCHTSARTVAMIFFIIVSATCFAYVYRSLGGDDIVEFLIHAAGLDSWGLLFLIMAIVFFLGFFLDWIEITLIVLPVFAPLVVGLDFGDHVAKGDIVFWFITLIAINLQTSFLTPPFGFALFYLKGIAPKEIKIQHIYRGIIPFVLLQLAALIVVIAYPGAALWLMHAAYG